MDASTLSDSPPKVFISWAHEDTQREEQVAEFAMQLRLLGIDADVDLYHLEEVGIDWTRWGPGRIAEVDHVLLIVSKPLLERWEGTNDPHEGAGAVQEADKLHGLLQRDQAEFQRKIMLVVFPGVNAELLPDELRRLLRFDLVGFSQTDLEKLVRTITRQPTYPAPPLGATPRFAPKTDQGHTSAASLEELLVERDRLRDESRRIADSLEQLPVPDVGDGPHLPWYREWERLQIRAAAVRGFLTSLESSDFAQVSTRASLGGQSMADSTIRRLRDVGTLVMRAQAQAHDVGRAVKEAEGGALVHTERGSMTPDQFIAPYAAKLDETLIELRLAVAGLEVFSPAASVISKSDSTSEGITIVDESADLAITELAAAIANLTRG